MVKRNVVGAHYGLRDWLVQRITGTVMAVYTLLMAVLLIQLDGSYESWRGAMSHGVVRFFTFLFVLSLILHAWVGVRDILMDYVKVTSLRLTLHVLTILVLVGYAGWAVQILWRL